MRIFVYTNPFILDIENRANIRKILLGNPLCVIFATKIKILSQNVYRNKTVTTLYCDEKKINDEK